MIAYFARHRTVANLLMVLLLVAGGMALPQMRAQFFPDVILDGVTVSVTWEGAGAEDVDEGIVDVIEPALLAVDGVTSADSVSREGRATVNLEFEPGRDPARAADDVEAALDAVTGLPDGIDDPEVRQDRWRDRVTDVVIAGPVGVDQLARIADAMVGRLFQEGVTSATIQGVAAPEVVVEVPTAALLREGVTLAEIAAAIGAEAQADPAGEVSNAGARVRTGVARRSAAEVRAVVIRRGGDGTALTVGDVATVTAEGIDRNRAYFVGGDPAVSLTVQRSAEGDAIALQAEVEAVAAELLLATPEGVTIDLIRTRTEAIQGRIDVLLDNALLGLALVVGLLFLFLSARTAFWVAAGIPVAMMGAIALMWAAGLTINMVSLFALIITLGIVVDDAIVVGEHTDYRHRKLGEPPLEAATNAARRMALPVFSATVTTVIAFFGLVVIGGRFGDLIADIPFTVIVVLIASLAECFLILPHHMAMALRGAAKGGAMAVLDLPSKGVNWVFDRVRDRLFRPLVRLAIWARYPVLAGAVVLLSTQAALFLTGEVQWRFFNAPERGSVTGNFAMSDGATRADALAQLSEMQAAVDRLAARYAEEHGANPVSYVLGEIGGNAGRGLSSADDKDPDQLGAISIELIDADLRPYSSFAFVGDLQDEVAKLPLTEEISFRGWRSGPGGDALSVEFSGADAVTLKAAAEDLKAAVAAIPEISAVEDSLPYDKDELVLTLTPQGEALGFGIDALGRTLRDRLGGIEAATFPVGPRTGSIRVEVPESELSADFLDGLRLTAPGGEVVALADIVDVDVRSGFASVRRVDGVRVVTVSGDIDQDDAARAAEIRTRLAEEILPRIASDRAVAFELGGLAEQEREFLSDALLGLILCLTGIYLTLAWIFGSWARPVVIMAVIPFGLIGAVWGHWWWEVPLSMFSVVGLIGMVGIIINDSIVLVTTVDEYAERRGLIPAIVDGAADRLRPVLLTTLTTVLGLAPLLYETSSQAQFLRPTVITLAYGLGFGMVLVLILVPAFLAMGHDLGKRGRALRRFARLPARRRGRGIGIGGIAVSAAVAAWGVATLGHALAFGTMWPPVAEAVADAGAALPDGVPGAFALFAGGLAVGLLAVWLGAAIALGAGRRRTA
ncbi:efflux RND transporter permease subunit [Jannaschia sp. Os4]|uniref:efflux RND transporter permease subunit n=1 Tax=Jannaschia sp. Os4 TaxID=2807617 RepID=UPI0019397877|nr:efflux RND transporter permease subunit [Jannaschia sp. Os4]MBM2576072.1 efflux RND transporter permease subunit [Jannaschia sp. Os4]